MATMRAARNDLTGVIALAEAGRLTGPTPD
jgi:hypothetical protein